MDELARYVAGPVAVASLGVGLYSAAPAVSALVWILAGAWILAAIAAWRKSRRGLAGRTLRIANRILACVPGRRRLPPMRMPSAYGVSATAAKFLAEAESFPQWCWRRRPRKYTRRIQRELVEVIEELAQHGVKEPQFEKYLSSQPAPNRYEDVSAELVYRIPQIDPPSERPP